jgi:hypothetical protein
MKSNLEFPNSHLLDSEIYSGTTGTTTTEATKTITPEMAKEIGQAAGQFLNKAIEKSPEKKEAKSACGRKPSFLASKKKKEAYKNCIAKHKATAKPSTEKANSTANEGGSENLNGNNNNIIYAALALVGIVGAIVLYKKMS